MIKFIHGNPLLRQVTVIVLSTNSIIDRHSDQLLELAHRRLIKEHCTPDAILEAIRSAKSAPTDANGPKPARPA